MKNFTIFILLALAACTPRLVPPSVAVPDSYIHALEHETVDSIPERWWLLFGDTLLTRYVEEALANNLNVRIAASRIEQARQARIAARASFLPQISADVNAQATHRAGNTSESYSIEPQLVWEVSLFGSLRNADRAVLAELESSKWAFRATLLSLAAEVVTTYYTLVGQSENLRIARESLRLRSESAALVDSMYRYGMSDGLSRLQSQTLVHSAASDVARYEQSVDDVWLSLCALMGLPPSPTRVATMNSAPPSSVPSVLPSQLLVRRPDVVQTRYGVESAAARAGAARAARFPSINLTASGGVASKSIRGLTEDRPAVWELAGSLIQPIFAFGKLRAAERAAVEQYNQAAAEYEQTVIEALAEVERALSAIESTAVMVEEGRRDVAASERIAEMTWARYRVGMSAYLEVLDAQRSLYDARMELSDLLATQRINYATLFKALGGGW